jgi:hypothetical protein
VVDVDQPAAAARPGSSEVNGSKAPDRVEGAADLGSAAWGLTPPIEVRERKFRLRLLIGAVVLVGAAFVLRLQVLQDPGEQLPAVPHASWILRGQTLSGGQPRDLDLLNLRDLFGVSGVVNLRASGSIEGRTVRDFGMSYLWISVIPEHAPDLVEMDRIVSFVRAHAVSGDTVFIHDDLGLERVRPVGVMMLLADGVPLQTAVERVTGSSTMEVAGFTPEQQARVLRYLEHLLYPGPVVG